MDASFQAAVQRLWVPNLTLTATNGEISCIKASVWGEQAHFVSGQGSDCTGSRKVDENKAGERERVASMSSKGKRGTGKQESPTLSLPGQAKDLQGSKGLTGISSHKTSMKIRFSAWPALLPKKGKMAQCTLDKNMCWRSMPDRPRCVKPLMAIGIKRDILHLYKSPV